MRPLGQPEVLQAMADLVLEGGLRPLAAGVVRGVEITWEGERAQVVIQVDRVWANGRPTAADLEAIGQRVGQLPGVGETSVALQDPEQSARPHPAVHPSGRRQPVAMAGTEVVAVLSGKGGVGKTTVAVNLAVALVRSGRPTALLDCDIYGYGVPAMLGVLEPPAASGGRLEPPVRHGVGVMSMDFFVKPAQVVMWRGPMLGKAFAQMLTQTAWGHPDVIVLDMPPGTGDLALDLGEMLPQARALVVTTPDLRAAQVAQRAGQMALSRGHRLVGVVETMSYLDCEHCGHRSHPLGEGGGDQVASVLGTKVVARIPWSAIRARAPDGVAAARSPAGRAYRRLAAALVSAIEEPSSTVSNTGG